MSAKSPSRQNPVSIWQALGPAGLWSSVAAITLICLMTILFVIFRPPSVDQLEYDIWKDWTKFTVDDQGRTLVDLVIADGDTENKAAGRLLETFGEVAREGGSRFPVRTTLYELILKRMPANETVSKWTNSSLPQPGPNARRVIIPLTDPQKGNVGQLEIAYEFYQVQGQGLNALPNLRRLQVRHQWATWLVVVLGIGTILAIFINADRLRERAGRLASQQITLDLARQMCHELRNGLWAFSLEGKNLRQLFDQIDDFFEQYQDALTASCERIGLSPADQRKFIRRIGKELIDRQVDPETDLQPANDMARAAFDQIENFSRYLSLTVEELDRNLLGAQGAWETVPLQLRDVWSEACRLLQMRLRQPDLTRHEQFPDQPVDWVVGDRRGLVHVFMNLLKNAIEAMTGTPGAHNLDCNVDTSHPGIITMKISNTGPPIPPDLLPRLFQSGVSTKGQSTGRGRGLALVHQVLDRMNASVEVTSSAEAGTQFILSFPQLKTPPKPAPSTTAPSPSEPSSPSLAETPAQAEPLLEEK